MIEEMFEDRRVQLLAAFVAISIALVFFKGIPTGLDLQGGSVIQIQAERALSEIEMTQVISILDERLRGGLGVKDVKIRAWGEEYILVELAGVKSEDAEKYIGKPGKLVVKVGNLTAFTGDQLVKDRIGPFRLDEGGWGVPFVLTEEGALGFRDAAIKSSFARVYMYMDDELANSAPISPSLQKELETGRVVKELVLSTGGGEEARLEAKRVETILKSGVLPIKVKVVGSYDVPATLGEEFARAAIIAGLLAMLGVTIVIYSRYRRPMLVVPIIITGFSEIVIILGAASLINWQIDLPAIAGIIATIGTGVDNQIVILDEMLLERDRSVINRMKSAFFIVMSSWMTLVAAMLPIFLASMGMLRGFAFTTILGATIGVFITRPAYARILQHVIEK